MKKDIEWAREQIKEERNLLNDTRYEKEVDDLTTGILLGLMKALKIINQLDEPETLSKEWIDKNVVHVRGLGGIFEAEAVEGLLVQKQDENK